MKSQFPFRIRRRAASEFVITFLFVFLIGTLIVTAIGARHIYTERNKAAATAEIQSARISHVIENELLLGEMLSALLEEGGGTINNFDILIPKFVTSPNIRNIALAPNGVIDKVYPLEGNEEAIGHDVLSDPNRADEASLAKESGSLTLSGPYELLQGGTGLVGRLPVYLTDENGNSYFWGFICTTIDVPSTLSHTYLEKLKEQGYAYELSKISPSTNKKQIISASQAPLPKYPKMCSIELPNSTWMLQIAPEQGWYKITFFLLDIGLILLFSLLCGFLTANIAELAKSKKELQTSLTQQSANYQLLHELNCDLRTFRHDMKNHMLSLSGLLERGDVESAKSYVLSMSEHVSKMNMLINTENYVFDALLSYKLTEASEKNIAVEKEILINRQLNIQNQDLSILLGNALDNAIEACMLYSQASPYIRVKIKNPGSTLHILIANTSKKPLKPTKHGLFSTSKSDRRDHGMGLTQIQSVVKKYNGVMNTSWENDIFTLSVFLTNV